MRHKVLKMVLWLTQVKKGVPFSPFPLSYKGKLYIHKIFITFSFDYLAEKQKQTASEFIPAGQGLK